MKILIIVPTILFYITVFAQNENQITELILYTVRLDDNSKKENRFYNCLDSTTKNDLINKFCDLAYNSKLKIFPYSGESIGRRAYCFDEITENKQKEYFFRNDTIRYKYDNLPYQDITISDIKRDNYFYRYLVNSLSFQEKWYFNKAKNVFSKKVEGVILFEDMYTHNVGMKCNYYLSLNDTTPNKYNIKYLIAKNIIYDVPITKFDTEKCNETNWWHNYLEASKRERFLDLLTYKALDDTIAPLQAYQPIFPYDSIIQRGEYENTGLSNLYYGRSEWRYSDPLMFGMTEQKILACCYELSDWTTVRKIRFNEEWYFDYNEYRFEKKVLGIGLIVDTYNEKGQVNGNKCLVYYKLNN